MRRLYRICGYFIITGILLIVTTLLVLPSFPFLNNIVTDWAQQFCRDRHFISARSIEMSIELRELQLRVLDSPGLPSDIPAPLDLATYIAILDIYCPPEHPPSDLHLIRSGHDPWGRRLHFEVTQVNEAFIEVRIWSNGVNGRDENGEGDDLRKRITQDYDADRKASGGNVGLQ